jgi:hypothetical protein
MRNHTHFLLALAILTTAALATPSGLNNIPTADTTPQGTFVLQGFTTIGSDRDADFNIGFKTGLNLGPAKLELGLASHLLPDKGGPIAVHGKVAIPFGENLPTLAIGAANGTFSGQYRDRAGDEFFYAVLSHDFGIFRVHSGCANQDGDFVPFFGIDKTFRRAVSVPSDGKSTNSSSGKDPQAVEETEWRDLFTVRADVIEQNDSSWLYSAGVLVPVCKHVVFETWGNFPDNGDEPSLTMKLNLVLKF